MKNQIRNQRINLMMDNPSVVDLSNVQGVVHLKAMINPIMVTTLNGVGVAYLVAAKRLMMLKLKHPLPKRKKHLNP
jgi:hypothetical protein